MTTVREQILERLQTLQPTLIDLRDESAAHAGHAGSAAHAKRTGLIADTAEGTHFDLTVVSPAFAGKSRVVCHQMIYALLDDLMKTRIHALQIDARPV
ncbi:MAG: BolA family transcriptional regulator [Betaproteobacteria bacterium]|nr:BolA family transcriptional regulator [Betaproteobacteria bacterium]